MTKLTTVLDAFKVYELQMLKLGKPAEVKNMQTALLRFTVPGWGGLAPTNATRSTKQDVQIGLDFLGSLPIEKLKEGNAAQEKVFDQSSVAAKQRTNARYYLNKLINLAESEGWLQGEEPAKALLPARLNPVRGEKVPPRPKLTDKQKKSKYALGSHPGDFINPRLQSEINGFQGWHNSKGHAEKTFNEHLVRLEQYFGWLVRYELASQWQLLEGDEKTAALNTIMDGLCFEAMIPFSPLPERSSFTDRNQYLVAKEDAKDIRVEESKKTIKLFKRFLDFYTENHQSRGTLVGTAVSITQYLYDDQIEEDNVETIPPILAKLKALHRNESKGAKNSPRAVPIEKKFIEYKEVLQVVVKLKKLADQKEYVGYRPREPKGIAKACSRFLIVSFLSLLPPDRQQLIRDLEIGTSFVKGCFGSGDIFIPEAKMSDPSKARWCFNLTKYKTRKTYGDCKITLPNYDLGDGATLYDYINLWLNHYRPLLNPQGNWLFVKHNKGEKLTAPDVYAMITKAFNRYAGKPVNPHFLRHIFNTHLRETNASESVKTASRQLMKQSDKIADSNYTHAITDRAVKPAIEYMTGLINEAFKSRPT